jgi:hypothetical protein
MSDFLASLGTLFLVLPLISALFGAVSFPPGSSVRILAWGALLKNLAGVAILASVAAQMTLDHMCRSSSGATWYPWITATILCEMVITLAIAFRTESIRDAGKWTESPEHIPELKFWRVPPALALPIFLLFLKIPRANVPYLYTWFDSSTVWLFQLPHVGPTLKVITAGCGALFLLSCVKDLIVRALLVVTKKKTETIGDF